MPTCPICGGYGRIECYKCYGVGLIQPSLSVVVGTLDCLECKGSGEILCPECEGHLSGPLSQDKKGRGLRW